MVHLDKFLAVFCDNSRARTALRRAREAGAVMRQRGGWHQPGVVSSLDAAKIFLVLSDSRDMISAAKDIDQRCAERVAAIFEGKHPVTEIYATCGSRGAITYTMTIPVELVQDAARKLQPLFASAGVMQMPSIRGGMPGWDTVKVAIDGYFAARRSV